MDTVDAISVKRYIEKIRDELYFLEDEGDPATVTRRGHLATKLEYAKEYEIQDGEYPCLGYSDLVKNHCEDLISLDEQAEILMRLEHQKDAYLTEVDANGKGIYAAYLEGKRKREEIPITDMTAGQSAFKLKEYSARLQFGRKFPQYEGKNDDPEVELVYVNFLLETIRDDIQINKGRIYARAQMIRKLDRATYLKELAETATRAEIEKLKEMQLAERARMALENKKRGETTPIQGVETSDSRVRRRGGDFGLEYTPDIRQMIRPDWLPMASSDEEDETNAKIAWGSPAPMDTTERNPHQHLGSRQILFSHNNIQNTSVKTPRGMLRRDKPGLKRTEKPKGGDIRFNPKPLSENEKESETWIYEKLRTLDPRKFLVYTKEKCLQMAREMFPEMDITFCNRGILVIHGIERLWPIPGTRRIDMLDPDSSFSLHPDDDDYRDGEWDPDIITNKLIECSMEPDTFGDDVLTQDVYNGMRTIYINSTPVVNSARRGGKFSRVVNGRGTPGVITTRRENPINF